MVFSENSRFRQMDRLGWLMMHPSNSGSSRAFFFYFAQWNRAKRYIKIYFPEKFLIEKMVILGPT